MKKYSDATEFYPQGSRTQNCGEAIASGKMITVSDLRDVEKSLAPVRAANKARRALKQVKIRIKTA